MASTSEGALVTVGIPTYNRPSGLRNALECVTRQDYANLEIIISDNHSTDPDVLEVMKEFAASDHRISYIVQDKNYGPNYNFFVLLKQATGKYFVWLADDDFWSSGYLTKAVQFLDAHSDFCCVAPVVSYSNKDGVFGETKSSLPVLGSNRLLRTVHTYFLTGPGLVAVYGVFRTNLLRAYENRNVFACDRFYLAAMAYKGKIVIDEDMVIHRRLGASSGKANEAFAQFYQTLGLKYRGVLITRFEMAVNAARDIDIQTDIYGELSSLKVVVLKILVFIVSFSNSIDLYFLRPFLKKLKYKLVNPFKAFLFFKKQ